MQFFLSVRRSEHSRHSRVVLFADGLLHSRLPWTNERVVLSGMELDQMQLQAMYWYLGVLLFSQCSGFSLSISLGFFSLDGSPGLSLDRFRYLSRIIIGFFSNGVSKRTDKRSGLLKRTKLSDSLSLHSQPIGFHAKYFYHHCIRFPRSAMTCMVHGPVIIRSRWLELGTQTEKNTVWVHLEMRCSRWPGRLDLDDAVGLKSATRRHSWMLYWKKSETKQGRDP